MISLSPSAASGTRRRCGRSARASLKRLMPAAIDSSSTQLLLLFGRSSLDVAAASSSALNCGNCVPCCSAFTISRTSPLNIHVHKPPAIGL